MSDQEHERIFLSGVESWNAWRENHPQVVPDLSGIQYTGLDLTNINLCECNLQGAVLRQCDLTSANCQNALFFQSDLGISVFRNANLSGAEFDLSELGLVKFDQANLERTDITQTRLVAASFVGANMRSAILIGAQLIETDLTGADLTGAHVYGASVWNVTTTNTVQNNLDITAANEPTITVDNLEVAQFIYLLIQNPNIRHIIDTITSKVVLILGRFTADRKPILEKLRTQLRQHDLVPVLFDFDVPSSRDTQETITTLARMARFIVADITDPKSIPQELVSIVESLPSVPVQPILQSGNDPWGMYDHIRQYPWVMDIHYYESIEDMEGKDLVQMLEPIMKYAVDRTGRSG